jgi:hypothetical protein
MEEFFLVNNDFSSFYIYTNCHPATATATATRCTWYQNDRTDLLYPTVPLPPSHCHSPSHTHPVSQPVRKATKKKVNFSDQHKLPPSHRHIHSHTLNFIPFEPHRSPLSNGATATQPLPLPEPHAPRFPSRPEGDGIMRLALENPNRKFGRLEMRANLYFYYYFFWENISK